MEETDWQRTDRADAVALRQIFEQGTNQTLSCAQRERVEAILLELSKNAGVEEFVSAAREHADLNEFALAVGRYFAENQAPSNST